MSSVEARLPYIWVPNAKADRCNMCTSEFSLMVRRHHCRSCGQVFCGNCCFQFQSLPVYLPRSNTGLSDRRKHRVCNACDVDITRVKRGKSLILIMSLLPVDITDFESMRCVCMKWKTSADSILAVFKALKFKISCQTWSGVERRMLKTHWRSFAGHSRLMVQSIRGLCGIVDVGEIARFYKDRRATQSCANLYCLTPCSHSFNPYDLLELICAFPAQQIIECSEMEAWIGTRLNFLDLSWTRLFLPFILQSGYTQAMQRIIANNILPVASSDLPTAFALYFECLFLSSSDHKYNAYYRSLLDRFVSMVDKSIQADLDASEKFLYALKTPDNVTDCDFNGARLPFAPHVTVTTVHTCNIVRLGTHTAPWIVPIETSEGPMRLLIKHDDLRKDRFVMSIVRVLNMVVGTSLKTYHVLPITSTYGILQMLPDCMSLFEINKTTTLTNYVVKHNKHRTVNEIRQTFIKSCASNCVLGYMLGVGDRNLGNILVCEDGTLVHIDFSYILGTDPRLTQLTEMRITPGMVDLLGGNDSDEYQQMKELCTDLYSVLKMYTYFWYTLLNTLTTAEPPIYPHYEDTASVRSHVEQRLMPHATSEEVAMVMTDILDKNSGSSVAGWIDSAYALKTSMQDFIFSFSDFTL